MLVEVLFVRGKGEIDSKDSVGDGARTRNNMNKQLVTKTYLYGGLRLNGKEGLICTHETQSKDGGNQKIWPCDQASK